VKLDSVPDQIDEGLIKQFDDQRRGECSVRLSAVSFEAGIFRPRDHAISQTRSPVRSDRMHRIVRLDVRVSVEDFFAP
jgi:hypothetical protein